MFLQIPEVLKHVKHEVELGVIIGKPCRNVSPNEAVEYIGGYCLGLDLSAFCELVSGKRLVLTIYDVVLSFLTKNLPLIDVPQFNLLFLG